eukprot:764299-Pelagomonas_calceolata.AAC.4
MRAQEWTCTPARRSKQWLAGAYLHDTHSAMHACNNKAWPAAGRSYWHQTSRVNPATFFPAQVHRHHPPLVYGRTMSENPEESVGIALCMVENTASGKPIFGLITYITTQSITEWQISPLSTHNCSKTESRGRRYPVLFLRLSAEGCKGPP